MKKLYLVLLPLLAMALSGCVKYNGRSSSNYNDSETREVKITLSTDTLSIEEGKSSSLSATVSQNSTVYWAIEDDSVASLSATSGLNITISALNPGVTTITASTQYGEASDSKTCKLTVTRKGQTPVTPGGDTPVTPDDPTAPVAGEEVTTYLVIGENGLFNGQPGKDVAELYLEYTVEFTAKVGDPLPTASEVTSTVKGSTFQAWQSYEGTGALVKHTTVPAARGKILYASFSGGQGSVTPPVVPPTPTGDVTLYFAGDMSAWEGSDKVEVNLAINLEWKAAVEESTGLYKATFPVTGSVSNVNVYMYHLVSGNDCYYHPSTGVQDNDKMNSDVNTGSTIVEPGKTYTITFTEWHYHQGSSDSWFKYTFTEGAPTSAPEVANPHGITPPTPPSGDEITVYFAGVSGWDIKEVHIAFDEDWPNSMATVTSGNGQYVNTVAKDSVSKLNIYFVQYEENMDKYRHPAYAAEGEDTDTDYSTIDLGGTTLVKGHSYVITWTGWNTHQGDNWAHAWFTYTFAELN